MPFGLPTFVSYAEALFLILWTFHAHSLKLFHSCLLSFSQVVFLPLSSSLFLAVKLSLSSRNKVFRGRRDNPESFCLQKTWVWFLAPTSAWCLELQSKGSGALFWPARVPRPPLCSSPIKSLRGSLLFSSPRLFRNLQWPGRHCQVQEPYKYNQSRNGIKKPNYKISGRLAPNAWWACYFVKKVWGHPETKPETTEEDKQCPFGEWTC